MDVGCYAVNMLRFLARDEPRVVAARARLLRPQVDRWMRAELDFADGRTARAVTDHLAGRRSGPLFLGESPTRAAGASAPRLTRFGADFLLKRAAEAAGIGRSVSANTLRHSYIALAHRGGADLGDISRRVGHLNVRDTRRFLG